MSANGLIGRAASGGGEGDHESSRSIVSGMGGGRTGDVPRDGARSESLALASLSSSAAPSYLRAAERISERRTASWIFAGGGTPTHWICDHSLRTASLSSFSLAWHGNPR